jgi:hypothetical protein
MQTQSTATPPKVQPPYPGAPTHTRVLGYFNPFDYPFQVHVPELNRQFHLGPREFLTLSVDAKDPKNGKPSRQKIKINDPIFESYVGPNKLSREEAPDDMPDVEILWLQRPILQPIPTHMFEFAGATKFATDEGGRVMSPEGVIRNQQQQMTPVPSSASAITGYTVEQARQMGIVKNPHRGLIKEEDEVAKPLSQPPVQRQLPQASAPRQPQATRPTPPPFAAQIDKPITMPRASIPPSAPVIPPPSVPVSAPSAAGPVGAPPTLAEMEPADDLLSDVPQTDMAIKVESTDLAKIAHDAAVKAGVAAPTPVETALPEPNIPESAPIVAAAPAPAAPPVIPTAETRPRRSRRSLTAALTEQPPAAPAAPQIPPPA